jgi:hypothetical protein
MTLGSHSGRIDSFGSRSRRKAKLAATSSSGLDAPGASRARSIWDTARILWLAIVVAVFRAGAVWHSRRIRVALDGHDQRGVGGNASRCQRAVQRPRNDDSEQSIAGRPLGLDYGAKRRREAPR